MKTIAATIAELRILIGYLGEKSQANWWSSDFFSLTATAFLTPIFNRSLFLAQYQGVTAAAAIIHDSTIGVGRIYHLFRLPISLEQASAEMLNDIRFVQTVQTRLVNPEAALVRLAELAEKQESLSSGPILVGQLDQDIVADLMRAAGMYHAAFNADIQTYPYMREVS